MKKNTIPSACRPYSKFATGTCQWQIAFLSSCLIIVFFCKLLLTVPGSFLNYNTTTHNKQGMDGVVWMHNTACMLSLYVIHFKIFLGFEIERIAPQSIEWLTEYPLSFLFFFLKFQFSKRVYLWSTTFHHIWNVCSVQCAQSTYALSSAIICPTWK